MLVQERKGKVYLLPACPKEWKSGKVTGVRLKTGAELDLEWKDGAVTNYELKNKVTGREFEVIS